MPHYPLSLCLTARLLQEGDVGGQASGPRKLRRKVSKRDEERAAKRSRGPQAHQMVAAARPTDLSNVSAGVGCAPQIPSQKGQQHSHRSCRAALPVPAAASQLQQVHGID
jgi:hypothetical protein